MRSEGIFTIHKARHIELEFDVVIKVLNNQKNNGISAQFSNESKILHELSLSHNEHIVKWIQSGKQGDYSFIVMDYVSGGSLQNLIDEAENDSTKRPSLAQIVEYVRQIADTLQYLHSEKRIIHCDIKPEHLLLDKNRNIVLCDFGLAVQLTGQDLDEKKPLQSLDGVTRGGDYRAPEQKRAKDPYECCKSDQYSLSLVAFELFHGKLQRPISPNSISQVLEEWVRQDITMRGIEHVLGTALSEDPQARYNTIKDFADNLAKAVKKVISSQPPKSSSLVIPTLSPDNSQAASSNQSGNPSAALPGSTSSQLLQESKQNITDSPIPKTKLSRRKLLMEVAPLGVFVGSWIGLAPKLGSLFLPQTQSDGHSTSNKKLGDIFTIYHGHIDFVNGLVWLPALSKTDNSRIASASYDGSVQVWDAITGLNFSTFNAQKGRIYDVAWSSTQPDTIASCSHTIILSDTNNGSAGLTIGSSNNQINAIAWSPDGGRIASASYDKNATVWDAINPTHPTNPPKPVTHTHANDVYDVTWSPDNKRIASCSVGEVHVWKATDGTYSINPFKGHNSAIVLSVSWIPTPKKYGDYIASSDSKGNVYIWSAVNGSDSGYPSQNWQAAVRRVAWSPNGKYLAAGTLDGKVYVWEAATGIQVDYSPYDGSKYIQDIFGTLHVTKLGVNALAWSQDGTKIAAGCNDGSVRVFSSGLLDAGII